MNAFKEKKSINLPAKNLFEHVLYNCFLFPESQFSSSYTLERMVLLRAAKQNQHADTAYTIGLNFLTLLASYNLVMKGKNEVFEFGGEESRRRRVGVI